MPRTFTPFPMKFFMARNWRLQDPYEI